MVFISSGTPITQLDLGCQQGVDQLQFIGNLPANMVYDLLVVTYFAPCNVWLYRHAFVPLCLALIISLDISFLLTRFFYKNNLYKKYQAEIRPKNKDNLRNKAG